MKKLLLTVVSGVALLAGSTCFATVPANQLELGGIPYGASISAVENAYGRPRKSEREMKSYDRISSTKKILFIMPKGCRASG